VPGQMKALKPVKSILQISPDSSWCQLSTRHS